MLVLGTPGAFLSIWTITEQQPSGPAAAAQVADGILARTKPGAQVAIIAGAGADDVAFADSVEALLTTADRKIVRRVNGNPRDGAKALAELAQAGITVDALAVTRETAAWGIFDHTAAPRMQPTSYYGSSFLTTANLLNIADQIAVIAIMAIGMTMVIIAGGIDLSVGSLVALSAVLSTWLIRECCGGINASPLGMIAACAAAIALCAGIGFVNGLIVTAFRVPAFIVTLGVMLIARDVAAKLVQGQSFSKCRTPSSG